MTGNNDAWGVRLTRDRATARLWAPSATSVALRLADGQTLPMPRQAEGWHQAEIPALQPGARYAFLVDGQQVPDPAARSQPDGPDGWSEIVDLDAYRWQSPWSGRPWRETVLYELHIGTFSREGTFLGAISHLDHLARLGVTMIELMPIGTFPGARNWGYDGVLPFAPDAAYGTPQDLQRLVDACHANGLSIVLDVVYNHFGPKSTYLDAYAKPFFTERHHTPWGAAINFDGEHSAPVRAYYLQNALMWLEDYRFDGLRLDAVQAIKDDSASHFLEELGTALRARIHGRPVHLMLENDLNEARWLGGPHGYDAQWNDDFHHVMRVLLAHQTDGYYEDYAEDPIEQLGRALTQGFSYQGQQSKHRPGMFRGTPSGHLSPLCFVDFLQNHDQVGNAPYGQRLSHLAPPEAVRLGAAVLLLSPGIPMLFMGEEWAASTPFDFFCDYDGDLADAVRNGRRDEFKRFEAFKSEAALAKLSDPVSPATAQRSALDWTELSKPAHAETLALHAELLRLRATRLLSLLDKIGNGRFTALGNRAITASWQSTGRTWTIAANFAPDAIPYTAPAGEILFAIGDRSGRSVSGWGFLAILS